MISPKLPSRPHKVQKQKSLLEEILSLDVQLLELSDLASPRTQVPQDPGKTLPLSQPNKPESLLGKRGKAAKTLSSLSEEHEDWQETRPRSPDCGELWPRCFSCLRVLWLTLEV